MPSQTRNESRVVVLMAVPPEILLSNTSICTMPTSRPLPTCMNSQCADSPPRSALLKPAKMSSDTFTTALALLVPPRVAAHTLSNRSGCLRVRGGDRVGP